MRLMIVVILTFVFPVSIISIDDRVALDYNGARQMKKAIDKIPSSKILEKYTLEKTVPSDNLLRKLDQEFKQQFDQFKQTSFYNRHKSLSCQALMQAAEKDKGDSQKKEDDFTCFCNAALCSILHPSTDQSKNLKLSSFGEEDQFFVKAGQIAAGAGNKNALKFLARRYIHEYEYDGKPELILNLLASKQSKKKEKQGTYEWIFNLLSSLPSIKALKYCSNRTSRGKLLVNLMVFTSREVSKMIRSSKKDIQDHLNSTQSAKLVWGSNKNQNDEILTHACNAAECFNSVINAPFCTNKEKREAAEALVNLYNSGLSYVGLLISDQAKLGATKIACELGSTKVAYDYAKSLQYQKRYDEALVYYNQAAAGEKFAYYEIAEIYQEKGDMQAADCAYQVALTRCGSHVPFVMKHYGDFLCAHMKDYDRAEQAYKAALKIIGNAQESICSSFPNSYYINKNCEIIKELISFDDLPIGSHNCLGDYCNDCNTPRGAREGLCILYHKYKKNYEKEEQFYITN